MTLLAVTVERERILVGADTQTTRADGVRGTTSKIFTLPHASAVLAGRGYLAAVGSVHLSALLTGLDFDDLAAVMPMIVSETLKQLQAKLEGPRPADFDRAQIVFAGWSKARGRMVGFCFTQEAAGAAIDTVKFVDRTLLAPGEPAWGDIHAATVPQMIDVARRQHAMLRAMGTHATAGGELIVAELTRDRISLEAVWDFEADAARTGRPKQDPRRAT